MINNSLQGLDVLLTRPAGQAEEWREQLSNLGASVVHIPSLLIQALPTPPNLNSALQAADVGIFVSTNAVRALAEQQDTSKHRIKWFCVGSKTEAEARQLGFEVVTSNAVDSESLLMAPQLQAVDQRQFVIVRGQGGRETIGKTLLARGAQVNYCEMYQRQCATQNADLLAQYLAEVQVPPQRIVTASSVDSLNCTVTLAEQAQQHAALMRCTLLVPSDRVAKAARDKGFRYLLQAQSMRLADIVYVLNKWWAEQR